jgi:hypothetical protein
VQNTSYRTKLLHVEKEVTNKMVTENRLDKYLSSIHIILVCSMIPGTCPSTMEHSGIRWKRIIRLSPEYFHRLLGAGVSVIYPQYLGEI